MDSKSPHEVLATLSNMDEIINEPYMKPILAELSKDRYEEVFSVIRLANPDELKRLLQDIDKIKIEIEQQLLSKV